MKGWGFRRRAAAFASPVFVALGIAMFVLTDTADARVFAVIAVAFFGVCGIMPWINPDTERGELIMLILTAVMGLACGGIGVGSALAGPNWTGVVIGTFGLVFFLGGAIAALIIRRRQRRRRR